MPIVELIAIGTELLLGEIQDTNTQYLARKLRDFGLDIYRTTQIGDNAIRIAQVISESLQRSDIVITTGGLGPTVDDPTRDAAARAAGVELEFQQDLWNQILSRFVRFGRTPTDNNRRQAQIPKGAIPLENEVGTAPAFIMEINNSVVICLPGVPREMEHILSGKVIPYLINRYHLHCQIIARIIHTAGVGESQIDEWIADLETLSNPTVGLLAHPGQVDIRITAKADSVEEANQMIARIECTIRERIGNSFFGCDKDTIENTLGNSLAARGWNQSIVECGLNGGLISRVEKGLNSLVSKNVFREPLSLSKLIDQIQNIQNRDICDCCFGVSLMPGIDQQELHLAVMTPNGSKNTTHSYGGPSENAPLWGINLALDYFRKSVNAIS